MVTRLFPEAQRETPGSVVAGRLDYLLKPWLRPAWAGPLNGQQGKAAIMRDIIGMRGTRLLVETGTFRGTTTAFLAAYGVPVLTVECNPRYYGFARQRLRQWKHVHCHLGDSVSFLRTVPRAQRAVFYLDAHWEESLPLADELAVIYDRFPNSIVMVDDFAVPGDSYGYDDYGPGKVLDESYLAALPFDVGTRYYPALPAWQESKPIKRGTLVLGTDRSARAALSGLSSLRS